MSDPYKEAANKEEQRVRGKVRDNYEPVVLWVRPEYDTSTPKGIFDIEEIIRREIRDKAEEMALVDVATDNEPVVKDVVTEFDRK